MAKVVVDINVSLDGFVAGPHDSPEQPAGEGGERLFDWMFGDNVAPENTEVMNQLRTNTGAVIAGRRTYDMVHGWGGKIDVPHFILSENTPTDVPGNAALFHFVNGDVSSVIKQAKEAAGDNLVHVLGGANTIQQALATGLVDEIQLHVVPVLLGAGVRLFENVGRKLNLEKMRVLDAPGVTHLQYRVASQ